MAKHVYLRKANDDIVSLDFVPQVLARSEPDVRDGLLCSREYWQANRVERSDA